MRTTIVHHNAVVSNTTAANVVLDHVKIAMSDESFLISYGSAARGVENPRDIDMLLVHPGGVPRYSLIAFGQSTISLHVVPPTTLRDDLVNGTYGWIFLTKFLSDYAVVAGNEGLAQEYRASSFLRLLGHVASTSRTRAIGLSSAASNVVAVLSAWNPQFQAYLEQEKIDPAEYQAFLAGPFLGTPIARENVEVKNGSITFRRGSAFLAVADLRSLLVRYWTFFLSYKMHSEDYLSSKLERFLVEKGIP